MNVAWWRDGSIEAKIIKTNKRSRSLASSSRRNGQRAARHRCAVAALRWYMRCHYGVHLSATPGDGL